MAERENPKSKDMLEKLKRRKLSKLLKRISSQFTFYKNLGKELSNFPVLSKQDYLENFQNLNVPGLTLKEAHARALQDETSPGKSSLQLGLSSGTSGHRGVFMTDTFERSRWVGTVLAKCFAEEVKEGTTIAFFLRANNELYENSNNSGKVKLKYFGLQDDPTNAVEKLNQLNPEILVAPPYILAALAKSEGLIIHPQKVFSVADILDPWDEDVIRKRFTCPLHQIYQATEGFLGVTCKNEILHLNEDLIYFEQVPVGSGRIRTIISDYHRSSQAIVRLALTDVLIPLGRICDCGSPMTAIKKIEGRLDEVFMLPDDEKVFRNEFVNALKAVENIPDFRLTQIDYTTFSLELSERHPPFEDTLKLFLKERGWSEFNLSVTQNLVLKPWEKRRRFLRNF